MIEDLATIKRTVFPFMSFSTEGSSMLFAMPSTPIYARTPDSGPRLIGTFESVCTSSFDVLVAHLSSVFGLQNPHHVHVASAAPMPTTQGVSFMDQSESARKSGSDAANVFFAISRSDAPDVYVYRLGRMVAKWQGFSGDLAFEFVEGFTSEWSSYREASRSKQIGQVIDTR